MKLIIKACFIAGVVLSPAFAFAQSIAPLTRDQVRADLVQLEDAGYNPTNSCTGDCPGSLRRAEASLSQRRKAANTEYGLVFGSTEQAAR